MYNVKAWLANPNRSYVDGLEIYNKYKPSTKYDNFFGVSSPGIPQMNMLYSKIIKVHSKLVTQPELIVVEKQQPLRVQKLTSQKKLEKTTSVKPIDHSSLRSNKQYINKLLTLNYSDMTFDDKVLFNNDETLFLEKKTIFMSIADSMRELRSLHANLKAIDPDAKNNSKRKKIIQDIAYLDDFAKDSWEQVDTWKEKLEVPTVSNSDLAVAKAIADQKRIAANQIFIKRALISIPLMPSKSLKQQNKKFKKQEQLNKRMKELEAFNVQYKS